MEKCRTFYLGKDESLEIGQPCDRLKQLKMRQVGWKIMGSGNKTTLVLEKARTLIHCCSLWAATEGEVKLRVNTPETPLSPCFLLMFLFSTLLRRSTETRRLAQLCWEQSTFVIGLLPPNLIKWCCSPLGREYSAKQKKCEFAAASSTAKGSLTDETLPSQLLPAWCSWPAQHLQDTHKWLWDADGLSKGVIPHHPSGKPLTLKCSLWPQK